MQPATLHLASLATLAALAAPVWVDMDRDAQRRRQAQREAVTPRAAGNAQKR